MLEPFARNHFFFENGFISNYYKTYPLDYRNEFACYTYLNDLISIGAFEEADSLIHLLDSNWKGNEPFEKNCVLFQVNLRRSISSAICKSHRDSLSQLFTQLDSNDFSCDAFNSTNSSLERIIISQLRGLILNESGRLESYSDSFQIKSFPPTTGNLLHYLPNKEGKDHGFESSFFSDNDYTDLSVVDFDNDGDLDVYACLGGGEEERGLKSNELHEHYRDNKFRKVAKPLGLEECLPSSCHAWIDVDHDGLLDLIVGYDDLYGMHLGHDLYLSSKSKYFTKSSSSGLELSKGIFMVRPCDLNGDEYSDLILLDDQSRLQFYLGSESSNDIDVYFKQISNPHISNLPVDFTNVVVADVDNDGMQEIIGCRKDEDSHVSSLEVYALRDFKPELKVVSTIVSDITDLEIVDFDLDGYLDIVLSTGLMNGTYILINNMDGGFNDKVLISNLASFNSTMDFLVADIDEDLDYDIVSDNGAKSDGEMACDEILVNTGDNKFNVVGLKFKSTQPNSYLLNMNFWVYKTTSPSIQYRTIGEGHGKGLYAYDYLISLGQDKALDSVIVNWNTGKKTYTNLQSGSYYLLSDDGNIDLH